MKNRRAKRGGRRYAANQRWQLALAIIDNLENILSEKR